MMPLGCGGGDTSPSQSKRAQPEKTQPSPVKLTEAERREIWSATLLTEERASREARKAHPQDAQAKIKTKDELRARYARQIRERYKITEQQYHAIGLEGINKKWPSPEYSVILGCDTSP